MLPHESLCELRAGDHLRLEYMDVNTRFTETNMRTTVYWCYAISLTKVLFEFGVCKINVYNNILDQ